MVHEVSGGSCVRCWASPSDDWSEKQRKERDELRLSFDVPKVQWDPNPTAPTATAMGNFFLAYRIKISTCFTWTDNSYLTHVISPRTG